MIIGIALVFFFLVRSAPPPTYLPTISHYPAGTLEGQLEGELLQVINEMGIPGLQLTIILEDVEYNLALGTMDYQREHAITSEHILRMGSVSKVYTAVLVMKLVEAGHLGLDDSIDQWFPKIPHANQITIRQLLNHTSGISNYTENIWFQLETVSSSKRFFTTDDLLNYLVEGKPDFSPGEEYRYSNSNYLLLGLIAEKSTGIPYPQLLHQLLLQPLHLQHTVLLPYDETPRELISGYDRDLLPLGPHTIKPYNTAWASAAYSAGGIASTSAEMAQFMHGVFHKHAVIGKKSIEEMMQFQPFLEEDIPEQTGYGLGLRELMIDGHRLIGHTGTIPGFGAATFYEPETGTTIAFLGNISFLDQIGLLQTVLETLKHS